MENITEVITVVTEAMVDTEVMVVKLLLNLINFGIEIH